MAWFCLLYLAVIGSALTFLLLYWLLPRMPVNNLQTISLITPPGAVAFGWLLGGETFSLWSLVGGALVLAGVWMIFRKDDRHAQPKRSSGRCRGRGRDIALRCPSGGARSSPSGVLSAAHASRRRTRLPCLRRASAVVDRLR